MSVCPQGGGCLPQCMLECLTPPPRDQGDTPSYQADPPPWDQADLPPDHADPPGPGRPPWTRQTPPGSRLQHVVYEQPVCILLECILVTPACHSVHMWGVSVSVPWGSPTQGVCVLGVSVLGGLCLGGLCPGVSVRGCVMETPPVR